MQFSFAIFFLFCWSVDMKIWTLRTIRQCRVSNTQMNVKVFGPLVSTCLNDQICREVQIALQNSFCRPIRILRRILKKTKIKLFCAKCRFTTGCQILTFFNTMEKP